MGQDYTRKDELITADLANLRQDAKSTLGEYVPRLKEAPSRRAVSHRAESFK